MEFIGLDIGASAIKAVELAGIEGDRHLVAFATTPLPTGLSLASEAEADLKNLAQSLDKFIGESGFTTRRVVIALPESQIFTRVVSLPQMSEKELANAINWEAGQYIPVPLDSVQMGYEILDGGPEGSAPAGEALPGEGVPPAAPPAAPPAGPPAAPPAGGAGQPQMQVLLVAAPKALVEKDLKVLRQAGLEPVAIESETIAASRALLRGSSQHPPTMVVSIGAETTDLGIVSRGSLYFTRSVSTGGMAMARSISQVLGFDLNQAEEYKKTYGLDPAQLEGKVVEAIKPIFNFLIEEIRRSATFYKSHYHEDLKRVVLCGGTASLPGIIVYLAAALGLEVQLGNPWQGIEAPETVNRQELESIGPTFAVAVGLALKEL